MDDVSEYEVRVLRRIQNRGMISGKGLAAITAAARRLERKGLAVKNLRWHVTREGQLLLSSLDNEMQIGENR